MKLMSSLLYFVIIMICILSIVSGYGGIFNPASLRALPSIVALAFPMFAALLFFLGCVSFFLSKKASIISFFTLFILCWQPLRANFPINFSSPSASHDFSFLTYNVAQFEDFSKASHSYGSPTIDFILSESPDIVALQEYNPHKNSNGFKHALDSLKKTYAFHHYWNDGQAFFSKYPLRELSPIKCKQGIIAKTCEVNVNGKTVTVVNLHLKSIGLSERDKVFYEELTEGHRKKIGDIRHSLLSKLRKAFISRSIQAHAVRKWIENINGPVVVCGDFNDVPLSYAQRVIMGKDLTDAYAHSARFPSNTFNDNRMFFHIDHILTNTQLESIYTVCRRVSYSDHYPVISNIKFTN